MPDDPAWWDGLGPAFQAAFADFDALLPQQKLTSREIESVLASLRRRGIEVVEAF